MKRTIDQTKRHIINVPFPFTEEKLFMLVKYFNGLYGEFEDDSLTQEYVDQFIRVGRMELNPSSALGDGANVVDTFNTGFMIDMKKYFDVDVNPDQLWWHPCAGKVLSKVDKLQGDTDVFKLHYEDVDILSNEHVMTTAIDSSTGEQVQASDLCPGNRDDLSKYKP